ncbi:hypothetical protein [Cupriavidus basilensis]
MTENVLKAILPAWPRVASGTVFKEYAFVVRFAEAPGWLAFTDLVSAAFFRERP